MIRRAVAMLLVLQLAQLGASSANGAGNGRAGKKPAGRPKNDPAGWTSLFDGKSLKKWSVLGKGDFNKHGKVEVQKGALVLGAGNPATGVRWTGGKDFPTTDYEVRWEAKRVAGDDFFSALTFPVDKGSLTFITGGWGGMVIGLSCIDGAYAINNDTAAGYRFRQNHWHRFRLRVTKSAIQAFIDGKEVIDFDRDGEKLSASEEMRACLPIGFATWRTQGAIRKLQFRRLGKASKKKP